MDRPGIGYCAATHRTDDAVIAAAAQQRVSHASIPSTVTATARPTATAAPAAATGGVGASRAALPAGWDARGAKRGRRRVQGMARGSDQVRGVCVWPGIEESNPAPIHSTDPLTYIHMYIHIKHCIHSALQRDITLGQSPRHSPLPCCTTTTTTSDNTPPIPPPFQWTDALLLPPGLSDRTLVEEGCECTEGRGCCHPDSNSPSPSCPCPCLERAKREAAAVVAGGGGREGGVAGAGGGGDGLVEEAVFVFPFECAGPRCRCPAALCRLRATQVRT